MRVVLLQNQNKAVPLHQVFHGIRFKVNKGWVKALTLFFYPYVRAAMSYKLQVTSYKLQATCYEWRTIVFYGMKGCLNLSL